MYSGSTLTRYSGRIMGAHQKLDRVSRQHLSALIGEDNWFPPIKSILHFEGKNGPDGIKRKSPAKDEPWHFYSPFNENDSSIVELISEHYKQLVKELKAGNVERSSFEAAWLAHAIVDGLTPAHHYPYEEKITDIRGTATARQSVKEKIVMPGNNRREKLKNNWKVWGAKGLFTMHYQFEWGVAAIIRPLSFKDAVPTSSDISKISEIGFIDWFRRTAREIAVLEMYDRFRRRGWTGRLTVDVRQKLAPSIIKAVTLAWYMALVDSGKTSKS